MNIVGNGLDTAFRTALLLGGSTKMAEAAVFDGIEYSKGVSQSSLVIETAKSVVRRCKESPPRLDVYAQLPVELVRLFLLDPIVRYSFVLRIFLRLPPEVCADILDFSIPELEDAIVAALQALPHLEKREHPSAFAVSHLTSGVNV
jgi:hypothetical protein